MKRRGSNRCICGSSQCDVFSYIVPLECRNTTSFLVCLWLESKYCLSCTLIFTVSVDDAGTDHVTFREFARRGWRVGTSWRRFPIEDFLIFWLHEIHRSPLAKTFQQFKKTSRTSPFIMLRPFQSRCKVTTLLLFCVLFWPQFPNCLDELFVSTLVEIQLTQANSTEFPMLLSLLALLVHGFMDVLCIQVVWKPSTGMICTSTLLRAKTWSQFKLKTTQVQRAWGAREGVVQGSPYQNKITWYPAEPNVHFVCF